MDGNNNLYPLAWAVVEVENAEVWCWFMRLLIEDLGKEEGKGLTIMSDRQKGLLEAFDIVTPKAEIRYCARHIWSNYKIQFGGPVFKDAFWKACWASTEAEFKGHLEGIKFLSPKAYEYLAKIPSKHWSRHAFSSTSKANMLLNNVCESFNNVLREARDKPILSLMEWIRRWVMKRFHDRRSGSQSYDDTVMPYVKKYLIEVEKESNYCQCYASCDDDERWTSMRRRLLKFFISKLISKQYRISVC